MNKVISINLNGRAYQVEEKGYELLREYLEKASSKLHDNPDKDELMADFEQAIADKCDARMSPRKNVVTVAEVEEIISAIGPVDASGGSAAAEDGAPNEPDSGSRAGSGSSAGSGEHDTAQASTTETARSGAAPKRLFRILHGEWIAGVCTGLAAYFGIDVTLMRVIFALLGVLTHGFWIAAYIILWIIMPIVRTEDDFAAAHGTKPFNAHDFIEQAKARAEEFHKEFGDHHGSERPPTPGGNADREEWKKWKQDMKDWKQQLKERMKRDRDARRAAAREARHGWRNQPWQNQAWQNGLWQKDPDATAGLMVFRFIIGIVIAALWIAFIYAVWTFLASGMIFGHVVGLGHPLWVTLLVMSLIFWIILIPFKAMMWSSGWHHSRSYDSCGHRRGDFAGELWTLAVLIALFYLASLFFPQVHGVWENAIVYLKTVR